MQVEARSILLAPRTKRPIPARSTASTEVHRYADDVVAGRIVAGPIVRDACRRHLGDLKTGRDRGISFDEAKASRAIRFFPDVLRLNGGQFEGVPFDLQPSQAFIVGSLFGWQREDQTRRFRMAYIEQGKGNGKSPLLGGVGLYGLTADGESRAEIYSAATKKDQAMILFRDAVAMVDQSPVLASALQKSGRGEKVYNLFHPKSASFFRPISSDDGQSGPRPHIGLIDELHEHRSANVINMMTAGRKWRRQPLVAAITNSGHDRTSVCWEYHEMARNVCAGLSQDDTFFAYVCALDDGEDPFADEDCWIKANPLLGAVIQKQYLRDEVNSARGLPSKESSVRRLNFCQWTESANPLIPLGLWDQCKREFALEAFRGRQCYLGIDLSATQDLTALVLACELDGRVHWWPMFWLPKEGLIAKAQKDHVPYDVWERAGWLRTTPGKAIDKDYVVSDMARLIDRHGIKLAEAPYDRARINEFRASLERCGVSWPMVEFGQGFISMGPAVDSLETSVLADRLVHNGNPCLRWNIANAVAVTDPAGNRKLDKTKSTGRIDGAVAGAMAHHRALQAVKPAEPRIRW